MKNIPIENRKLIILEIAKSTNDYIDCDVIQSGIEAVEKSTTLENLIYTATDLKNYISFRVGQSKAVKGIDNLIDELSSIHIKNLIN
jgi:hypothetical protein